MHERLFHLSMDKQILEKALVLCCEVPGRASRAWYFHRPALQSRVQLSPNWAKGATMSKYSQTCLKWPLTNR